MSKYFSPTSHNNDCRVRSLHENYASTVLNEKQKEAGEDDKDVKFMIFESFQLDCISKEEDKNTNGNHSELSELFCSDPYTFCVLLNPNFVDEKKLSVIRKIIENEKPAHTKGKVVLLEPWFYLGMHSYIGINTVINKDEFTVGKATIGSNTTIYTTSETTKANSGTMMYGQFTH